MKPVTYIFISSNYHSVFTQQNEMINKNARIAEVVTVSIVLKKMIRRQYDLGKTEFTE